MHKDDFGFFFDDDQTETIAQVQSNQEAAVNAAKQLYERINALLVKLEGNPDKPTINWPDRLKHVAKFRSDLIKILDAAGIKTDAA